MDVFTEKPATVEQIWFIGHTYRNFQCKHHLGIMFVFATLL